MGPEFLSLVTKVMFPQRISGNRITSNNNHNNHNNNNNHQSNGESQNQRNGHQVKMRNHRGRRTLNQQDISKRLSLPADLQLPEQFVTKQLLSPTAEEPLTRQMRRQSLVHQNYFVLN